MGLRQQLEAALLSQGRQQVLPEPIAAPVMAQPGDDPFAGGKASGRNKLLKNDVIEENGFINRKAPIDPDTRARILEYPAKADLIRGRHFNDVEQTNSTGRYTPSKNTPNTYMGTKPLGVLPAAGMLSTIAGAPNTMQLLDNVKQNGPIGGYAKWLGLQTKSANGDYE